MNLDTRFAIDFGSLLELYLDQYGSPQGIEQVCFILQLDQSELSQVLNGYDVPSIGSIFELLRHINDPVLTNRFLRLPTVLGSDFKVSEEKSEPKIIEPPKRRIIDPEFDIDDDFSDFGDVEL